MKTITGGLAIAIAIFLGPHQLACAGEDYFAEAFPDCGHECDGEVPGGLAEASLGILVTAVGHENLKTLEQFSEEAAHNVARQEIEKGSPGDAALLAAKEKALAKEAELDQDVKKISGYLEHGRTETRGNTKLSKIKGMTYDVTVYPSPGERVELNQKLATLTPALDLAKQESANATKAAAAVENTLNSRAKQLLENIQIGKQLGEAEKSVLRSTKLRALKGGLQLGLGGLILTDGIIRSLISAQDRDPNTVPVTGLWEVGALTEKDFIKKALEIPWPEGNSHGNGDGSREPSAAISAHSPL